MILEEPNTAATGSPQGKPADKQSPPTARCGASSSHRPEWKSDAAASHTVCHSAADGIIRTKQRRKLLVESSRCSVMSVLLRWPTKRYLHTTNTPLETVIFLTVAFQYIMLHAAHTTKKTWWRNIIRYSPPRLYRMSCTTPMTAASTSCRDIMHGTKCVSAPPDGQRGLDQAGEQRVRLGRRDLNSG